MVKPCFMVTSVLQSPCNCGHNMAVQTMVKDKKLVPLIWSPSFRSPLLSRQDVSDTLADCFVAKTYSKLYSVKIFHIFSVEFPAVHITEDNFLYHIIQHLPWVSIALYISTPGQYKLHLSNTFHHEAC